MDTKYHIDIFERSLKERSDEFRIYPSNRVWHGIYNSIHPGRKLPSAATSILLLAIFFLTGFLNSNLTLQSNRINNFINTSKQPVAENIYHTYFFSSIINDPIAINYNLAKKNSDAAIITTATSGNMDMGNETAGNSKLPVSSSLKNKHLLGNYFSSSQINIYAVSVSKKLAVQNSLSAGNEIFTNAYSLNNNIASKKWTDKLTWQLYATPSVIYRGFSNNTVSSNLAPSGSNQNINNTIWQKPSVGIEAGTALLYSISPVVKLKAGLQFNYSEYNTDANSNFIKDASSATYHSEIYQISLPIGTELKLLTLNKNIQLNVGLTLQPTYITGGNSYSESLSKQDNTTDASLLNNWNLNAGFETFISYKASGGYTWKIGPAIRYQLFSTYNNSYLAGENLTNFGIQIGVSKEIY